MEAIHLAQEAIITQQREEIEALESLVIEYQETIFNLTKNRQRLYWYNWIGHYSQSIKEPEDRGIMLKDILEDGLESTTTMHTENNYE